MFGPRRSRRPRRGNRPSGDHWDPTIEALVPGPEPGHFGHGDLGSMQGPEYYRVGSNYDFRTCPVPFNGNERSITVMNDNGNITVWRDVEPATGGQNSRQGGQGPGDISVGYHNGRWQLVRDGQLVASGGRGRRGCRSGGVRPHHHGRGGMHRGFNPFGHGRELMLPGIFDDSDISDDPFSLGGRSPPSQAGWDEDPFRGQRTGGDTNNTRGPPADEGDYDDDDDYDEEGEDEDVPTHHGQYARYGGAGRHGSRTIRPSGGI